MLDRSCQVQRRTHAERGLDLYETPEVATTALLRVERLPHRIWEPACGRGAIVSVLQRAGHLVRASDLVDYGGAQEETVDFLSLKWCNSRAIVTNPPFRFAEEFVAQALRFSPLVIMLLRLAFLESERRTGILENRGLARIHVFRKRLPMMHRAEWQGRKANSGMAFGWFVWIRHYVGPTFVDRTSWER